MKRVVAIAIGLLIATSGPTGAQEPLSPVEYYQMHQKADALFESEAYAEAIPLYERLIQANPGAGALHYNLALSFYFSGNSGGAIPEIMTALELGYGREPEIAFRVGKALAESGQSELALHWLGRALEARYTDRANLRTDEAFDSLRSDPAFARLAMLPPEGELSRAERWRFDLDYFLAEARRLHANPDNRVMAPEFEASVEELKSRVPDLTNEEITVELQEIVAGLGDGHTSLWGARYEQIHHQRLPVEFYFFSDGLFVIDAADEYQGLIGKRVDQIGTRSIDTVVDDLKPYVSRDNDQALIWIGPFFLRNTSYLKAMGYTEDLSRVRIVVSGADGSADTQEVEAAHWKHPGKLGAPPGTSETDTPLYLKNTDQNFWHTELLDGNAYYLQLNSVLDKENETLVELAADVYAKLVESGARTLVIDLRLNGGGNNTKMWPIIRVVAAHEMASPDNQVFVIVGRNTFSACQNLVNYLDRMTNATFAGEPTSSKVNFTGESSPVTLPFSKLQMSISSRYWQDGMPEDTRPWVAIDVPVALSSADYFANRDPVLETVTRIANTQTEGTAAR